MTLYMGLGANIGRREETIDQALGALDGRIGALVGCSSLYETRPIGFVSSHLFLNAVAAFETTLTIRELIETTQAVERELGRTAKSRDGHYCDRTIDLDLLMLGDEVIDTPDITLPHPRMELRRFVLEPLCELDPEVRNPRTGQTAREMLAALNRPFITEQTAADEALLHAVNALLPQLSDTAKPLSIDTLRRLVSTDSTHIYTVSDEEQTICGMATLCLYTSPTGTKAWIEDVVVDSAAQGRGYARSLISHLMNEAGHLGAKAVLLTSRPERIAANALYRRCGFEQRVTNVYRYTPPRRNPSFQE